jgi:hypothetical protein
MPIDIIDCLINYQLHCYSSDANRRPTKQDARQRLASICNPTIVDLKQLSSLCKPLTGEEARQERWNRRTFNLYYADANYKSLPPAKQSAVASVRVDLSGRRRSSLSGASSRPGGVRGSI